MKIVTVFGTRPEAIKLAPVIGQLERHSAHFRSVVCVTAQHRQMLDQVLHIFDIQPDYDLDIMTPGQDLFDVTCRSLERLKGVLKAESPDAVLVQGDTTTAFAASLAAYYLKIPVGHVEAGLRTHNPYNPFPEEKNRHMVGVLATYHFAPTEWAKSNLALENVDEQRIWVTGNTVIDALLTITGKLKEDDANQKWLKYFSEKWNLLLDNDASRLILVTGHRRESFGEGFQNICRALADIARQYPSCKIVYPVHLNPNVREPVQKILGTSQPISGPSSSFSNVYLIDPLEYEPFLFLMEKAFLILTDSGGIQEEAPSLAKPVLVMRNTTERPEGVQAGTSMLVGTDRDSIVQGVTQLMNNAGAYQRMAQTRNPYGDGRASERIAAVLNENFSP